MSSPEMSAVGPATTDMRRRWSAAMMDTYGVPAVALCRGDGAVVDDVDGRSYLDLVGGIAVNVLGHAHPAVRAAVDSQLARLGHVSNLYAAEPQVALAEKLIAQVGTPSARVFLCNSGAEANEAAFKIARRTGRGKIVAARNAFHGRTMGALALTGQEDKRLPFEPLPAGVVHVPFGDTTALAEVVDSDTAAVVLEPIMGEYGVVVPAAGYLAAAREITAAAGALLILDEIQTGMGRTGTFFAYQADEIVPDVITLAKGLGGGLPIGACIAVGPAAELLGPGRHGSTFGGNPACAAAALAVLQVIDAQDLVGHAGRLGRQLAAGIERIDHALVDRVRGRGLLLGVVLTAPAAPAVQAAASDAGFLINAPRPDVIRLTPPLILTERQVAQFLAAWPTILDSAREGR